jgi:hypothetical protein
VHAAGAAVASLLQQILEAAESPETDDSADPVRAELIAVARRYSQQDFCQEPVLRELVRVITRRLQGLSSARREALEKSVTSTLFEDQSAHVRLRRLWAHLTGMSGDGQ